MTLLEAEPKDTATGQVTRAATRFGGRLTATATHAVAVIVPAERPAVIRYGVAVAASAVALAATVPLATELQRTIFVLFWPAVIGAAWFGGVGPGILASVLSVAAVEFFVLGTPGVWAPVSSGNLPPLGAFLFASTSVALVTNAARRANRAAADAAAQNANLAQEIEAQALELEQQLVESQQLSEELEQSTEELADRTAAAEHAEAFTRGILDSISNPFVVHDGDWRFRYMNDAAAAVFRQSPRASHESPIGRVLWEVFPDIVGTVFEREMRRAATERRPVTFEAFYPVRGEWSVLSCFPLPDGGLATQWVDVTAKKRAEEAQHFLGQAGEILGATLDFEATLERLAEIVVPRLADWCVVHVVGEDGVPRQLAAAHVDPAKAQLARELSERFPERGDAGAGVPNVARTGLPEVYGDVTDLVRAVASNNDHLHLLQSLDLRSAMIVPLQGQVSVLGTLSLVSAESGRRYSERDLPLATDLARRAALAVENSRLHRQAITARERAERTARVADRLFALTARLSAAATPAAVAEAVLAEARATFGAERGTMSLVGEDGETMRSLAHFGYDGTDISAWRSYVLRDWAPPRVAVESGRGVFLESNADARTRFPEAGEALARVGVETAVVLPIADGRVIAVLSMSWTTVHPLPTDEREFMELFASQCGQALGRAIAFESEQVARERTERLQHVTAALAAARSEREVSRVLLSNLEAVLHPQRIALYLVAQDEVGAPALTLSDHNGVRADDRKRFASFPLGGDSPIALVARSGTSVFLEDGRAFTEMYPWWARDGRSPESRAWAAVALTASTAAPLGAVALGFAEDRTFGEPLRRYATAIVDQAALAVERVRLLEAEHRAREAAEEANRAKTQFLATMSHELRTPLNAISGYAELLSLGLRGPTTPEQQEDLARIMRSQRHLLSVINDILNFARLEAGHVEYHVTDVPVGTVLADLEPLIRPQLASKELEFLCDPVSTDVIARADPEKLRQVLLNLLANAVKFTAPGGSIRVTCDRDNSKVRITVADTGIGIPSDRRSAIFEPFVQLHRTLAQPAEGTGLGLAISRDLARGMGGELSVESEPGAGSTFILTLDLAATLVH